MTTMKRIPTWLALLDIVLTAFVALSILSILIYAPFWILGGLSQKRRRPAERGMRMWPLLAVLSLIAIVVIVILCSSDLIPRLGNLTAWSAALFLATIAFAVAAVASAIALWFAPADRGRSQRGPQILDHGHCGPVDSDRVPRLLGLHRITDVGLVVSRSTARRLLTNMCRWWFQWLERAVFTARWDRMRFIFQRWSTFLAPVW